MLVHIINKATPLKIIANGHQYVPRLDEVVIIGQRKFIVEEVITDYDLNKILVICYEDS